VQERFHGSGLGADLMLLQLQLELDDGLHVLVSGG
jgi:hypothetical protein